jgi:large subunit ribosomal protein L25
MAQSMLAAQVREKTGKGAARKLRQNEQIPAIFYGPDTESIKLTVNYSELEDIINKGEGENIILDLKITSEDGSETKKVILKELQVVPVQDTFIHADFYEISMDKEITVDIPIRLVNTPVGVTLGGILQQIRRELTVTCLPDKLVDSLEVDVSELEIGDSVHIKDIELPEGIFCADEAHLTVAVLAAPSVKEEEEVEEEELEEEAEGESKEEASEPEAGSSEK